MAESLFPYIGLPMAIVAIAIGGSIFLDLLAAYGLGPRSRSGPPRQSVQGWLMKQGRLGQEEPPPSKLLMAWRLLIVWALGFLMLTYWVVVVSG